MPAGTVTMLFSDIEGSTALLASSGNTALIVNTLELAAAIMAGLGDSLRTARLAGAADAIRQESGMLIAEHDAAMLEAFLAPARAAVAPQERDAELAAGRALTLQEATTLLLSAGQAPSMPA